VSRAGLKPLAERRMISFVTGNVYLLESDLGLKKDRVFGYRSDFGDEWYHQIDVLRIEQAVPTVAYPRTIKRVGTSPPQYSDDE
jgi:hypothetical protein